MTPSRHDDVSSVRFVVDVVGSLGRICKVGFTTGDGSLYVFPYGPTGRYFFGRLSIPAEQQESTVPFKRQETSDETPKLSIHESGQVHVRGGGRTVGPMFASALADLRGEHLATVTCIRFAGLVPLGHPPKLTGPERDIVFLTEPRVQSGRLVLYANADEPSFVDPCPITARLVRPTLEHPLFVGVRLVAQVPLDETSDASGVVVIAGWDPLNPPSIDEDADHLFVVAK